VKTPPDGSMIILSRQWRSERKEGGEGEKKSGKNNSNGHFFSFFFFLIFFIEIRKEIHEREIEKSYRKAHIKIRGEVTGNIPKARKLKRGFKKVCLKRKNIGFSELSRVMAGN